MRQGSTSRNKYMKRLLVVTAATAVCSGTLLSTSAYAETSPPVIKLDAPTTVKPGEEAKFELTESHDPDGAQGSPDPITGAITHIYVDWGDGHETDIPPERLGLGTSGETDASAWHVSHTWHVASKKKVKIILTDDDGETASVRHYITINTPPVMGGLLLGALGPMLKYPSGDTLPLNGDVRIGFSHVWFDGSPSPISFPNELDTNGHLARWWIDWGDGAISETTVEREFRSWRHVYSTLGIRKVKLIITDDLGGRTVARTTFQIVENQPPILNVQLSADVIDTGSELSVNFNGTHDPDGVARTVWVDWGDGTTSFQLASPFKNAWYSSRHTWDEPGLKKIKIILKDNSGEAVSHRQYILVRTPAS